MPVYDPLQIDNNTPFQTWRRTISKIIQGLYTKGATNSEPLLALGMGRLALITAYTVAAGGENSINFTGALTSRFNFYVLLFDLVPETDNVQLMARLGTSGSYDSGASDYLWTDWRHFSNATNVQAADAADSEFELGNANIGNASGEGASGVLFIFNPSGTTSYKRLRWLVSHTNLDAIESSIEGIGRNIVTTAKTDIQLLMSSGQIAAGGIAQLYGLANA